MSIPLVSICIPCYNAQQYIEDTLKSLLSQTYPAIEIIVVDDKSTDDCFTIIETYAQRNSKIVLEKSQKKGAAAARNQAYGKSKGDLIIFFDADDLINPDFIASQVELLKGRTDCVSISNWGRFFNNDLKTFKIDNQVIRRDLSFPEWIIGYWTDYKHTTPPGRILIPRKVMEAAGGWNEALSLNDDFEFFTRVFLNCKTILYNDSGLFYYRSGIGGLSASVSKRAYESYYATLSWSLNAVLTKFPNDVLIKKACANLWQMFIYHTYPEVRSLRLKATSAIKDLGGASISFPAGGYTKALVKLCGWKLAKRLKTGLT
jgi:glycosyltransferase involved in cell wall biosynthesis